LNIKIVRGMLVMRREITFNMKTQRPHLGERCGLIFEVCEASMWTSGYLLSSCLSSQ